MRAFTTTFEARPDSFLLLYATSCGYTRFSFLVEVEVIGGLDIANLFRVIQKTERERAKERTNAILVLQPPVEPSYNRQNYQLLSFLQKK